MHKIQPTPKIITIIGIILEGIAGVSCWIGYYLLVNIDKLPGYSDSLLEMTSEELEAYEFIMDLSLGLLSILAIVISVMFVINLILFSKLINGRYTEEQAKKVYLYQAIWGGINLVFNTVTGILYLVSGVQGYNGQVDRIDIREGI